MHSRYSPASSESSIDIEWPSVQLFLATRSRVVRFPHPPDSRILQHFPPPVSMWTLRDNSRESVWAVFKTHQEACTALSLSSAALIVAPALDLDLEPFHKLQRFDIQTQALVVSDSPPPPSTMLEPVYIASRNDYTLSSNPPNPRTSFRLGDWICSTPKCAAHNFGRNLACIGCGCPRSSPAPLYQAMPPPPPPPPSSRPMSSPRFQPPPPSPAYSSPQSPVSPMPSKSIHPLLTPSGRAFAVGGKVQNISSDPLSPCIMYWPDNEPFPEQGQIRPSGLVGVPQPPILNTGNRGPISHQPGDWICQKCNYLNWRRRKVCQTCLPYAEGNGDSISAAVQAERIALLTSVLAQTHDPLPARSHSLTPPQVHRPFINTSPPHSRAHAHVHRSHSQFELGTQYNAYPIYQTSGHRDPAPLLLPSFLQDIVQQSPPMLSPVSTSSADLSFDEYEERRSLPPATNNIWRMDGEETKSLAAFGASRKSSLENIVP
ncbi:uncharacterized protein EV420DRAFT_1523203 [Desarmillaria tabescens]|uniref:RanBP2-type domain-containing protein n=1 Tax=Armillaria tabescens TaxID=1929756 RepID=A0AA39NCP9_ARMTA|nr:uncharacterized protein EV420DRAFT_1523203 [Desarmillaria tabescens]KAK0463190.1 hypothetical protein EV420DRAFT_1523203 [Desarmillaria tabescens]